MSSPKSGLNISRFSSPYKRQKSQDYIVPHQFLLSENQPIASIPELSEGDKSHQKVKRRMFHMREPSGKKRSYSFVK
jgi:hypothetical protein